MQIFIHKYAQNMHKYAKLCSDTISISPMHSYAFICTKYAKICKICMHESYMQNMSLVTPHFADAGLRPASASFGRFLGSVSVICTLLLQLRLRRGCALVRARYHLLRDSWVETGAQRLLMFTLARSCQWLRLRSPIPDWRSPGFQPSALDGSSPASDDLARRRLIEARPGAAISL